MILLVSPNKNSLCLPSVFSSVDTFSSRRDDIGYVFNAEIEKEIKTLKHIFTCILVALDINPPTALRPLPFIVFIKAFKPSSLIEPK